MTIAGETVMGCEYCSPVAPHKSRATQYCSRCCRSLCTACYEGLKCPKQCHARPQGGGVK